MERSDIETGTVIATEDGHAMVLTNKSRSCKECGKAEAGICGKRGAGITIKTVNTLGGVKGDIVEIGLEGKTHAKAYFIMFILPVIILFLSAYAGHSTGIKGLDITAGITGLFLSLIYSFVKIHQLEKSAQFYITKVLHAHPDS